MRDCFLNYVVRVNGKKIKVSDIVCPVCSKQLKPHESSCREVSESNFRSMDGLRTFTAYTEEFPLVLICESCRCKVEVSVQSVSTYQIFE